MEDEDIPLDELLVDLVISEIRESAEFLKYDITISFEARLSSNGDLEIKDFRGYSNEQKSTLETKKKSTVH